MDIDTTPPSAHHEGRPAMQLDLSATDEVMMEVDPDVSPMTNPLASPAVATSPTAQYSLGSPLTSPHHPSSMPRSSVEGGSPALRPLPVPPVVLISSSDSPASPKFKLDQLFVEWLARPESRQWLETLLEDVRSGKSPDLLAADQANRVLRAERSLSPGPSRSPSAAQVVLGVSPQQAPGSPVSRLFRNHIPFGDSDSSPRSPTNAPSVSMSPFRSSLLTAAAPEFDLGRSGTASPVVVPGHSPAKDEQASRATAQARLGTGPGLSVGIGASADSSGISAKPSFAEVVAPKEQLAGTSPQKLAEQASDSKALDKVADGIAGMNAVVDKVQPILPSSEMKVDTPDTERAEPGAQVKPSSAVPSEKLAVVTDAQRTTDAPGLQQKRESETQDMRVHSREAIVPERSAVEEPVAATPSAAVVSDASPASVGDHAAEELQRTPLTVVAHADKEKVTDEDSQVRKTEPVDRMVEDKDMSVMDQTLLSDAIPPSGPKSARVEDSTMAESTSPLKNRKSLPRFYFPCGRDAETRERKERQAIKDFFRAHRVQKNQPGVSRTEIAELVVEVIGLPSYFATIIFSAILELFPSPPPESGAKSQDVSGAAGNSEGSSMGDNSQRDEGNVQRSGGPPGDRNVTRTDTGGTNSDTTMGDVNEMPTEERRVNGFHTSSGAHCDSTPSAPEGGNALATASVGAAQVSAGVELISEEQFTAYYGRFAANTCKEGRLFSALRDPRARRSYLIPSDFKPLLEALLMCHQGLAFLHATPEFQQRYSETVIERIYFGCTRQHNSRLTLNDIKRSKLLDTLMMVDEEEDINRERKYFSYEHFYVLYCRFWELDANHDLQIDREDLMRYGSHSLTYRIVDRIFGGYARPLDCPENPGFMSYTDFIWFCLCEEDKTSDTAIDYWFRCVDMDGDGLITMYDMEFFYKEQLHRMECFGHEAVQIRDILCQLLDMINPNVQPPVIRRGDLKRCRLAGNFFNVLFNLNKFFAIEARDPLQIRQEHATPELTDWDRFAALEYLRLSAEEEGEEDESWDDVGEAANPLMAGEAPF